jgi:hypothetical protein
MKRVLKNIIPIKLRNKIESINLGDFLFTYYYKLKIKSLRKKISQNEKIKVAFILMDIAMWKYEGLYQIMANHPRFNPVILIAPRTNQNDDGMKLDSLKMIKHFGQKGYKIIDGYDFDKKCWYDIKENIKPNIIFYTQPYNNSVVDEKYSIRNFKNQLFCYIPYSFLIVSHKWGYDSLLQNIAWKLFYPTNIHIETAKSLAKNKGTNVCVTGYPIADEILDVNRNILDPWKNKNRKIKRIIWGPHHSIFEEGSLNFSNFLNNHQTMFDLAKKYKDQIHIAFKPHPILLSNLYNHSSWGKEKADAYYNKWEEISNGQLETGEYIDLMLESDAMIHDSGSFMAEYLYTKKPVFYLAKNNHVENLCNFGKLAFDQHYKGYTDEEIEQFIVEVVLGNNDLRLEARKIFFNKFLLPPNDHLVAENVFNEILVGLKWNNG